MFGLLNLNKPVGVSSAGILGRIKQLVRPAKIGHAGTLDPLASGVLVACVGPATRLAEYVRQMPKSYRASFLLGQRSESDDVERAVTFVENAPVPRSAKSSEPLQRSSAKSISARRLFRRSRWPGDERISSPAKVARSNSSRGR